MVRVILAGLLLCGPMPAGADVAAVNLRCEYRCNPMGIEQPAPRLSWEIAADSGPGASVPRGLRQTAYRVLVASSEKLLAADQGDLWDSGKIESDQSLHVTYEGKPLSPRTACFWKVRCWTAGLKGSPEATAWSKPARWTMGLRAAEDWQAKWLASPDADADQAVWLRKGFDLSAAPERAMVSATIAGYAELYVNGKKVGGDVLTPAISDHSKQVFYVTYDVASLLHKGRNVVGIWLGRGWAQGKPSVRAQLDATLPEGPLVVGTDATWKCKASSHRHIGGWKHNNFGGDRYDARQDLPGWCEASLDDNSWADAAVVAAPRGAAVAQQAPLNRIGKSIPATAVKKISSDGYQIDFGTALTGWLRLKMPPLAPGSVVKMTFADVSQGRRFQSFGQVSEFVSAGKPGEVFVHKFNYAGFRYVRVEGLPSAPAKEDAEAMLVESDLEPAGDFECSNDLFTRIHRLTQ